MKHFVEAALTAGWDIIGSYFAWMIKYSNHPEKADIAVKFKKVNRLTNHVFKRLRTKFIVTGTENIPDTISCFFPNHLSAVDPVILCCVLKKPISFVAKKSLSKAPFVGRIIRTLDGEFIDREDLRQSLKVMQNVEKDLTNGVKNWAIFPEGTRNRDINSFGLDFHYGSFKAAMKAKVPLVPVAFYGSFRPLKKDPEFKFFPIQISFLKPVMPEEYEKMTTQEVAKIVQDKVRAEVLFKLRPNDHKIMSSLKSKKYSPYHIH